LIVPPALAHGPQQVVRGTKRKKQRAVEYARTGEMNSIGKATIIKAAVRRIGKWWLVSKPSGPFLETLEVHGLHGPRGRRGCEARHHKVGC
jgi:hypothetical protein